MTEIREMDYGDLMADAELAAAIANAEKLQAEADMAKLAYVQEEINHRHQLDGVYTFHKGVTRKSMDKLFEAMHIWHGVDSKAPWTIYLNSGGGEVFAGNGIIDELAAHSLRGGGTHEITIKVRGQASSMAAMILQAADHRLMGPYACLMIHKGSLEIGGTYDDLVDGVAWFEKLNEWMVRLFLSRTDKISVEEFNRKIDRRDWWLSSEEAISMGFADRVG